MKNASVKTSITPRSRSRKVVVDNGLNTKTYLRPHKCTATGCGKAFTRVEHLRRHQLNHKPQKAWNCESCTVAFAREDLWQRHLKTHHSNQISEEHGNISEASDEGSQDQSPSKNSVARIGNVAAVASSQNHDTPKGQLVTGDGPSRPRSEESVSNYDNQRSTEMLMANSHITEPQWWNTEDSWDSAFANYDISHFANHDIDWFLHNQYLPGFSPEPTLRRVFENSSESGMPTIERSGDMGLSRHQDRIENAPPPPIYLHDSETKILMPISGLCETPKCGFRICNALTDQRRFELLLALRNMAEIDTSDKMFSLNNMKQGIHLYSRNISIEHAILHPEALIPSCDESLELVVDVFGYESPPELLWAVISFGWTLLKSKTGHEYNMATKIQRILRKYVLGHPAFTLSPPLWLVQTLFLILMFARYQGGRQEYGFSSIFHGVLLDSVRRLDFRPERTGNLVNMNISPRRAWIEWIRVDTLRRTILDTFIFDAKHAILHGSDLTMTPFELNLKLPFSDDAWYATSPEEWAKVMRDDTREQLTFLTMLKRSWNPTSSGISASDLPRGSTAILHGIISIAREIVRREENSFSTRSKTTLSTLSKTVAYSLDAWKASWAQNQIRTGFQSTFLWRTCYCLSRLAYTLYEVGPVDLQTVAGKEVVEGKRRSAADYAKSKRKIRTWVRQDRALVGISNAAQIIEERLHGTKSSRIHCHHCFWSLYLAGLICWNFGFATTGTTHNHELNIDGRPISDDLVRAQCSAYLAATRNISGYPANIAHLDKTGGMLIVLIRLLKSQSGSGLIEESIEVLARLVGLNTV